MYLITATPRNKNGSMSFTIPSEIAKKLEIKHGDQFQVEIEGKGILFSPTGE
jgi:AbrB family looped-hinge helix DNA binding protein